MYGLSNARKGSTLLQLVFTVVAIYGATQNVWKALLIFALTALLYRLLRIEKLLPYSLLVALIPSLWLALSNALIVFLKNGDAVNAFVKVFIRAEVGATIAFLFIHTLNISELSYILHKVSFTASLAPHLLWRISSQLIKESEEILYAYSLKKERMWKALAMLFIRGDELIDYFTEGIFLKQYKFRPRVLYSLKTIALQAMSIVLASIVAMI
jgi:hypothetical protein